MRHKILSGMAGIAALMLTLVMVYAVSYSTLCSAAISTGGRVTRYCAMISGGQLSDGQIRSAQKALGMGYVLGRGADGRAYGYFAADSALSGASAELKLRGVLGAWAQARRWVAGEYPYAEQYARKRTEHVGFVSLSLAQNDCHDNFIGQMAEKLIAAVGDTPQTKPYIGEKSASQKGERYHAAVRAADKIEFMLAEGCLPADY